MAKISYTNLKLKNESNTSEIVFNDNKIEVSKYLSVEDKYDLVNIVAQNSLEEGIYHPIKLEMFFHLYLVYLYTNISFTDKQKENEIKIYDNLKQSGLLDLIIEAIPENEYNTLLTFIEEYIELKTKYSKSIAGVLEKLITDLPAQAEAAMEIVNNFDKEKFKNVIDFASAANGGKIV